MLNRADNQNNKKAKKSNGFFGLFQNTANAPTQTQYLCSEDQCSVRPVQPVAAPASSSFAYIKNENDLVDTDTQTSKENHYLAEILPPDYFEAMMQAAKQGFLYSFVSSTPIHLLSDYFKSRNMTHGQIFYANLVIRAITVISLSAYLGLLDTKSLCMMIGIPLSVMTLKLSGVNELTSQLLPITAVITTEIVSDLSNAAKFTLTLTTAASFGWLGNRVAQVSGNFIKNSLFAVKAQLEHSNEVNVQPTLTQLINNSL